jgi:hypothetical protein
VCERNMALSLSRIIRLSLQVITDHRPEVKTLAELQVNVPELLTQTLNIPKDNTTSAGLLTQKQMQLFVHHGKNLKAQLSISLGVLVPDVAN